jgi:hypothetical protein
MTVQIENIPDLIAADLAALRSKQIITAAGPRQIAITEDIWRAMADNPEFIASLGLANDADKKRVLEALAKVAAKQSNGLTKNWFAMHIADLIVAIAILSSLAYVLCVDHIRSFIRFSESIVIGSRYVVVAPNGLPPFHIISDSDIGLTDGSKPAPLDVFKGRYANEGIPHGAVIDSAKLSSGMRLSSFEGLAIFEVKLQPTVIFAGINLPVMAKVLVSPHGKDPKGVMTLDAYVLRVDSQKDGAWTVLAATQDDFLKIEPDLPQSALFAVGPVH